MSQADGTFSDARDIHAELRKPELRRYSPFGKQQQGKAANDSCSDYCCGPASRHFRESVIENHLYSPLQISLGRAKCRAVDLPFADAAFRNLQNDFCIDFRLRAAGKHVFIAGQLSFDTQLAQCVTDCGMEKEDGAEHRLKQARPIVAALKMSELVSQDGVQLFLVGPPVQ